MTGAEQIALNVGLGGTVDVENAGDTLTLSGVVSGSNGLTKIGDGTLTLSGSNTYTGGTLVSAGKLVLGSGGSLGQHGHSGGQRRDLGRIPAAAPFMPEPRAPERPAPR